MDASTYTPNPSLPIHTCAQTLTSLGYTGPRIIIGHQSAPGHTSPAQIYPAPQSHPSRSAGRRSRYAMYIRSLGPIACDAGNAVVESVEAAVRGAGNRSHGQVMRRRTGRMYQHRRVRRRLPLLRLPNGQGRREGSTVGRPEHVHKVAAKARPLSPLDVSCRIHSDRRRCAPDAALFLLLTFPAHRFPPPRHSDSLAAMLPPPVILGTVWRS